MIVTDPNVGEGYCAACLDTETTCPGGDHPGCLCACHTPATRVLLGRWPGDGVGWRELAADAEDGFRRSGWDLRWAELLDEQEGT